MVLIGSSYLMKMGGGAYSRGAFISLIAALGEAFNRGGRLIEGGFYSREYGNQINIANHKILVK